MTVYPLSEDRACFFLPAAEYHQPESLTVERAKSLMRQAFAKESAGAELEGYWSEQGVLLFVRQHAQGADFSALLRQEILTGRGILIMEAFAQDGEVAPE